LKSYNEFENLREPYTSVKTIRPPSMRILDLRWTNMKLWISGWRMLDGCEVKRYLGNEIKISEVPWLSWDWVGIKRNWQPTVDGPRNWLSHYSHKLSGSTFPCARFATFRRMARVMLVIIVTFTARDYGCQVTNPEILIIVPL
jgi:hypothetical protein